MLKKHMITLCFGLLLSTVIPQNALAQTNAPQSPSVVTTASDTVMTVSELRTLLNNRASVQVLDVRRPKAQLASPDGLPMASWHDPEQVSQWAATLDKEVPVVVYCVHGHEVSTNVMNQLRALGYRVKKLGGGIEAWNAEGGATAPMK